MEVNREGILAYFGQKRRETTLSILVYRAGMENGVFFLCLSGLYRATDRAEVGTHRVRAEWGLLGVHVGDVTLTGASLY